jgi:hypothetical protein
LEMVPEQEAPVAHEVILADAEPKLPQPRFINIIMRDLRSSRFGAGLEIRRTRLRVPYVLDHSPL